MIEVTIRPDNGEPYDLTIGMRDVALWEKTHKGKKLGDLRNPAALDLYQVAHLTARRKQLFSGDVNEFMDSVEIEFDADDDDAEPDPTQPGH